MEDRDWLAEINMARIPVSADVPGLLFTLATVMIFYWGIPELRQLVLPAVVLGCCIAFALHFLPHRTTGEPWIPRTEKN